MNTLELKIDARKLTAERFEQAVTAFFDLLRSVTDNVSGAKSAVQWFVEVESGSAIVRAVAESDAEEPINAVCRGVSQLASGASVAPQYFTNVSLRAARQIASIYDTEQDYVSSVSLKNGSEPIEMTRNVVAAVDDILGEKYDALGSVEGMLQTISERNGFKLAIYDIIFDEAVVCYPKDEKVQEDAMRAFGKRVIVVGSVRYRRDGKPSSVVADSIQSFPEEDELPNAGDIQKIYAAC